MKREKVSVGDLMTREVTRVTPNDTLDVAEVTMMLAHVRHLPVVEPEGTLVGVISNRDLFRSALSFALGYGQRGRTQMLKTVRVKEVMSEPVQTIGAGAPIAQAASIMLDRKIGSLPVVEGEKLVGMLTETDILRHVVMSHP